MLYLVCYDVVQDRRRNRVSNLLKGYGVRVQKSVFECVLNEDQYDMICRRLSWYIDTEEDQVRLYPMTKYARQQVKIVGLNPELQIDDNVFVM
jgi:CRISPR-associated protein Cas2